MDFQDPNTITILVSLASVPIFASLFALMWRLVSPIARLTSRLARDSAIYSNLPEGEEKIAFGDQLNIATKRLNRYRQNHFVNAFLRASTFFVVFVSVPLTGYKIYTWESWVENPWTRIGWLLVIGASFVPAYIARYLLRYRD
jgi:hypothetical protein